MHPALQSRLEERLRYFLSANTQALLARSDTTDFGKNPDGNLWWASFTGGKVLTGETMSPEAAASFLATVAASLGSVINARTPRLEGEFFLGTTYIGRFEGLYPPLVDTPSWTIRKHLAQVFTLHDYVAQGIVQPWQVDVLRQALRERKNILIAGATSAGKTTFLNSLLWEMSQSDPDARLCILEDTKEITCRADNVFQARTSQTVSLQDLTHAALRLSPSRLIVGEVRGREAADLMKILNTGHPGSCCTLHADSAASALTRIEELIEEAGLAPNRQRIARAIDLIVFLTATPHRHLAEMVWVSGVDPERGYQMEVITAGAE